ncbi:M14 family zinc carboxypeptidase [Alteromonas sp. ASW11-19]|uniref:M14 family zinc carboxypeptidase n=1 Tax=Alteromonas salexigens TaxID=2982530 RepID=A0ABT2VJP8_9ALTE|nr:M14 family zinc carboxypeptidase [Alteromonas salexigens]MCU7553224.1 M14 family zinc carboxypeptidase [Alteromonas salexigens]
MMLPVSLAYLITDALPHYQWPTLDQPHLYYADIAPLIAQFEEQAGVGVQHIGNSYEGKPIHRITVGHGPLTVLAWTQMHGDEPTTTAAVLDWLNMLSTTGGPGLPAGWASQVTLHIIPMLNPDGAQRRTRVNAQGIDINRDARALQSPEGQLLHAQVTALSPDIAFNLHDQSRYYAAGNSGLPATLAFLAPPFNAGDDINPSRLQAMQLITAMFQAVNACVPGHVSRYEDSFSARCFGDSVAARGVSTILIESGAARKDPHRQQARSLTVVALHTALCTLLANAADRYSAAQYQAIPVNRENGLYDFLLKGVTQHPEHGAPFRCDIGINADAGKPGQIVAIGDLTGLGAFYSHQCNDWTALSGKQVCITTAFTLTDARYLNWLRLGVTSFYDPDGLLTIETCLPVNVVVTTGKHPPPCVQPGDAAVMLLRYDSGRLAAILGSHWQRL